MRAHRSAARRCAAGFLGLATAIPAAVIVPVATASPAAAAGFTDGNLVVLRVGDGAGAIPSGAAAATFLDEYTPAGDLVQTIALPTVDSGANRQLTLTSSSTSEGALSRSADGAYLTLGGYDAAPGTTAVASTTAAAANRVLGRVDGNGVVDTPRRH